MNAGQDLYRKLMAAAGEDEASQDYDGLDQGPIGTGIRHNAAIKNLRGRIKGKAVLDLGCGTGLLLKSLAAEDCLPKSYVGVELLEERRAVVMKRIQEVGVKRGDFLATSLYPIQDWTLGQYTVGSFDCVLALGLMGPYPFHTLRSLTMLISEMQMWGDHGMVTIPMQRPDFLGCERQAHFDMGDVADALRDTQPCWPAPMHHGLTSEKEMMVYW